MEAREAVARVRGLSDEALLAGLSRVLGSSRQLVALLVVHLAEVEERRLHLLAGHGSMFAYCTNGLGMSEDEAYRRIEVARLARHFPVLFERLATGRISLSVAALLKAHLNDINHVALLNAVAGKTVKQAREVLAAWFPRPDVLACIRKLPRPRASSAASGGNAVCSEAPLFDDVGEVEKRASAPASTDCRRAPERAMNETSPVRRDTAASPLGATEPRDPRGADAPIVRASAHAAASGALLADESSAARSVVAEHPAPLAGAPAPTHASRPSSRIEPLSPERYKVVFTADADLKRKLDLARDLLRHAVPDGDLPAIIGRALDLLLEKTLQRRFAKATRRPPRCSAKAAPDVPATPSSDASAAGTTNPSSTPMSASTAPTEPTPPPTSRHLPSQTRRAVLERDGLRCTWVGPDGVRCESRAWLEHDHIQPRGLGGDDDPTNIRIRCRPHNRLAAEQAYGQAAITRIIARHRARKKSADIADVHEPDRRA